MRPISRCLFLSHYGLSGNCLPSWQKILHGLTGIWHSTHQANICVELLNLLLQMCFQESKWSNMRRRPGRYRELTALPRPLTGQMGKCKEKEGVGGENGNGKRGEGGKQVRDTGKRREREKEGEKERREVCPHLQLLHPPVFSKQFHTVKAVGHRVRRCLSFACGKILGWVITSNGVSVDGRTEEGRGPHSLGPPYTLIRH